MPVFKNQEAKVYELLTGDVIWTVLDFEKKVSEGAKTKGSDIYELKLKLEQADKLGGCYESLTDHETCDWKLDTFIKSAGVPLQTGVAWDFDEARAKRKGWQHVNPYGLRGWGKAVIETYTGKTGEEKKRNKITVFYTDREKLPRDTTVGPKAAQPATPPPEPKSPSPDTDEDDIPF